MIFALSGVIFYTAVIFVDKYLLEKRLPDSRGIVIFTAIVSLVIGSIVWFAIGTPLLPFQTSVLLLFSGLMVIGSTALYFHVLAEDNASFVQIFFQLIPIFVIAGAFLLGERMTLLQIIGSSVVIIGTIALAKADGNSMSSNRKNISRSVAYMILYDIMWAVSALCIKSASSDISFPQLISYESFGIGLGGLLLVLFSKPIFKSFRDLSRNISLSTLIIICLNEGVLFLVGKSLLNYAYTLGSASLVSVVESTQIVVVLIVGFALSTIWPRIFKENTNRRILIRKLVYTFFVLLGITVISA